MPVSRARASSLSLGTWGGGRGGAANVSCEVAVWLKVDVSMAERFSRKDGSDNDGGDDDDDDSAVEISSGGMRPGWDSPDFVGAGWYLAVDMPGMRSVQDLICAGAWSWSGEGGAVPKEDETRQV